jgi:hypothetical protein
VLKTAGGGSILEAKAKGLLDVREEGIAGGRATTILNRKPQPSSLRDSTLGLVGYVA